MQQQGAVLGARVAAGTKQLTARDQRIAAMQQEGGVLQARLAAGSKQLEARDTEITRKQARIDALLQEGRSLDATGKKELAKLRGEIDRLGKRADFLLTDGNRRIQSLEKRIDDGKVSRAAAQSEIDELTRKMREAARAPAAPAQANNLRELRDDIASLRKAVKSMPRGAAGGAAPIVVQGGAGGGGASSSAGGSSAASGGGGAAPRAAAPDLSKVVEAIKAAKESGGKRTGSNKGISQARRAYTDKRKSKIAELRALKSRRIREFNSKTKTLPKADRDKQRREYKKRVEAQFKEAQQRFPTARSLKSVSGIRELIRKIDAFKAAK
jgi:hypothetical protein